MLLKIQRECTDCDMMEVLYDCKNHLVVIVKITDHKNDFLCEGNEKWMTVVGMLTMLCKWGPEV